PDGLSVLVDDEAGETPLEACQEQCETAGLNTTAHDLITTFPGWPKSLCDADEVEVVSVEPRSCLDCVDFLLEDLPPLEGPPLSPDLHVQFGPGSGTAETTASGVTRNAPIVDGYASF